MSIGIICCAVVDKLVVVEVVGPLFCICSPDSTEMLEIGAVIVCLTI